MVRDTLTLDSSSKINVRGLNIWYDDHHAIIDADLQIRKNTALIVLNVLAIWLRKRFEIKW